MFQRAKILDVTEDKINFIFSLRLGTGRDERGVRIFIDKNAKKDHAEYINAIYGEVKPHTDYDTKDFIGKSFLIEIEKGRVTRVKGITQ